MDGWTAYGPLGLSFPMPGLDEGGEGTPGNMLLSPAKIEALFLLQHLRRGQHSSG